jgi:flagellar biosynthesis protein FlhB
MYPMHTVVNFFIRLVLVAAGLVFAASLALMAIVLLVLWCLRAVWCKLTGKPINPFVMRMSPGAGFGNIYRSRQAPDSAESVTKSKRIATDDVTDVQAKDIDDRPR